MDKPKRDVITPEMRERLLVNRDGRLTVGQWLAITTDPLVTLLLLLSPGILLVGLRLPLLIVRGWLVLLILLAAAAVMLALRARRYARLPLRYHILYAAGTPWTRFWFWKMPTFYDDEGRVYRFGRWLAPRIPLNPDHAYAIYYLEDAGERALCSVVPLTHPDVDIFQPTTSFHRRFERRQSI